MLKTEEIDMDIFKSFIDILSRKTMLDKAVKLIKEIPVSKISVEMLPLIADLQSKLSTEQSKEIDEYFKKNTNLAKAAAVTANLMN